MYIYIYIYTHTHTYIYIEREGGRLPKGQADSAFLSNVMNQCSNADFDSSVVQHVK